MPGPVTYSARYFSAHYFQVTVDLGKDAEFQCSVTGQPHPVISWAKDGLPMREGSSGRSKITGNDGSTLRISSIVRDDKGMYQCFAKNDYEMVQATAELRLGGEFEFLARARARTSVSPDRRKDPKAFSSHSVRT